MKKLPWFPCYQTNLLGALSGMTSIEAHVYVVLLLRIYECGGPCPETVKTLAKRTGNWPARVRKALASLIQAGRIVERDGGYCNPLAMEVIENQKHRSHCATVAVARRWEKHQQKQQSVDTDVSIPYETTTRSVEKKESDSSLSSASQGSAGEKLNGHHPNDLLSDDGTRVLIPASEIEALQAECPNYAVRRNIGGLYRSHLAQHLPFDQRKKAIFSLIRKRSAERAANGNGKGPELGRPPGWGVPVPGTPGNLMRDRHGNILRDERGLERRHPYK